MFLDTKNEALNTTVYYMLEVFQSTEKAYKNYAIRSQYTV